MARREYKGAATPTRLLANIDAVQDNFSINSNAGWPTGGANGPFVVILDPDVQGKEEHVLVNNQAGGNCTNVTRGYGDTTATTHSAGADGTVIHGVSKVDYDEANRHINDTTIDEHTQYMKTDGTRHDLSARHVYGGALGTRPVPVAVGTALAAGSGNTPAAGDHVHTIGAGAINNNTMFTAGVIGAGRLAAGAIDNNTMFTNGVIGSGRLAVGAISAANMFGAGVVDQAAIGTNAVGADELATGAVAVTADIVDGIITLAKFASEAGTTWGGAGAGAVGPFNNLILGTGGVTYAKHFKLGRLTVLIFGFQLGTGGDLSGPLSIDLPFNCANVSGFSGDDASVGGFVAARAFNNATDARVSGTGVFSTTEALNFVAAFTSSVWSFDQPFDWSDAGSGSKFQAVGIYEATS